VYHVYTMRNHCPLTLSLTLTPFRFSLILLDSLDYSTWLPGHVLFFCCRLIINTIYLCPANPNPSQSLSALLFYNTSCQDRGRWTLFYFRFPFFILLFFSFSFKFLFLEQLGLGFISHAVTSVTNWWHNHKTNHEMWEKEVEGSRTSDVIQHGHHMLASCITHGHLG